MRNGVLAQVKPAAGIVTDAYLVPATLYATITSIIVTNQGAVDDTFRISISVNAVPLDPIQYIFYDVSICANETMALEILILVNANDIIRVSSGTCDLSFNIFGAENKIVIVQA